MNIYNYLKSIFQIKSFKECNFMNKSLKTLPDISTNSFENILNNVLLLYLDKY